MTTTPAAPEGPPEQASLVLSAERLDAAVRRVPVERVLVRRVVVTEEVALTAVVRREVLRVEREPLGGADPTASADAVDAEGAVDVVAVAQPWSVDLVLHEERPVVSLEVVPVERVRVAVVPRAGVVTTTADLRREVASVDVVAADGGRA